MGSSTKGREESCVGGLTDEFIRSLELYRAKTEGKLIYNGRNSMRKDV